MPDKRGPDNRGPDNRGCTVMSPGDGIKPVGINKRCQLMERITNCYTLVGTLPVHL